MSKPLNILEDLTLHTFIHEMLLVYKLETVKNCKEVKHVMIMIIAIICIFLILRDTWWTVENYFQKIPRPPWKNPLPPPPPLAPPLNSKIASPPLFANIENFTGPSCRKEGAGVETVLSW